MFRLNGRLNKTKGLFMFEESRTIQISVIMPIYRTKVEYLRLAIESVLTQSFRDFEFIILNDSPDDKRLREIVYSFGDKRVRYYENEGNVGIARSYNKLLDLAEGKYIALMNHDDEMKNERLAKQFSFLEQNQDVGLVGTAYKKFGEVNRFKNIICPIGHDEILAYFLFKSPVHHPTIMMRNSIIKEHKISYDDKFISLNDRLLCWEFSKYSKISNLDEVLYKYRFHKDMTSKKMKKDIRKERALFHKLWFEYNKVELNPEEVEVFDNYITFGRAKIRDKEIIKIVVRVLEKLVDINDNKNFLNKDVFEKVCASYARKRCLNAIFCGFVNVGDLIKNTNLPLKKKKQILLFNTVFGWR